MLPKTIEVDQANDSDILCFEIISLKNKLRHSFNQTKIYQHTPFKQFFYILLKSMFPKVSVCFCFSILLILAYSKVYNINLNCGTCQNTTGCIGNKCVIFTGDVTAEYCNDNSACSFSLQQNMKIGQCSSDFSGSICSSGVCMASATTSMCYSSGGFCLDGVSFVETCSGSTISITESGGILGSTPIHANVNLGIPCPFTSATGSWSTCSGDGFGSACNCCFAMQIQGMSIPTGSCIAASSPIVKVKAQLGGAQGFISMVAMTVLLLMLMTIGL